MTSAAYRRRRIVVGTLAGIVAVVLVIAGYAVWQVARLGFGIQRSSVLDGQPPTDGKELNILLMGLDSRLDINGQPLSQDLYDALHSGDASDGGLNSNVLMFLHVPADGSRAVAFSIPRDGYADLDGCPDKVCKGKIKTAYGLAFDQASRRLAQQGVKDYYQQARDAGRKAQIKTVEKFLGVTINHFVEVTMVAFFEIAKVVQPVTVCVKEDTVDSFSGADFKAGQQQISAEQAVAFVRQRRDTRNSRLQFTDLDRSRRQQAFIVSLLTQLKTSSTLTNPSKVNGIIDVAKRNTAIDDGLDPLSLVRTAQAVQGGNLSFYTLPVKEFQNIGGQDVNIVDLPAIQAMVKEIMNPSPASPSPSPSDSSSATLDGHGYTVDVVNASGTPGAAKAVQDGLAAKGYARGSLGNAGTHTASEVAYAAGAADAAQALAAYLGGVPVREDKALTANRLKVTLGTSFQAPADLKPSTGAGGAGAGGSPGTGTTTASAAPVDATGGGVAGPPPTALTQLSGSGVPCVK